jgi:hypothetical protein
MRKINHQGKCQGLAGSVGPGVVENGGDGDVEPTFSDEGETTGVGDVGGVGVGEVEVVGDGEGGRTGVGDVGPIGVGETGLTSTDRVSLATSSSMRLLVDKPIWT